MKLSTSAVAASILAFTSAAPASYWAPPSGPVIHPTTISQYSVWTGAVKYAVEFGKIFKDGHTTDITTLVTFDIPSAAQGKQCTWHLALDSTATVTGTGVFDVFTSLAPATQDTTTWPNGNLRDNNVARMKAVVGGEATFLDGYPTAGKSFPCPYGYKFAGELVGTGDNDNIAWDDYLSGVYLSYA
jgi:hypothetical protein